MRSTIAGIRSIMYLGLCTCAILVAIAPVAYGDPHHQVVVRLAPGVVSLQAAGVAPIDGQIIHSVPLRALLLKHGASGISKAFPRFNRADTLGHARTGEVVKLADRSEIYLVTMPTPESRRALISELEQLPVVIFAEPNGTTQPTQQVLEPDDPYFQSGAQWALKNTGQSGGSPDADIDGPEAWAISQGSVQTIIAIIDTGIEAAHPDLTGKVTGDAGYGSAHGTGVAGVAAAITDNGIGIAGVDWNARLVSQRTDTGEGDEGLYAAISDAVAAGADVLNNSWRLIDENQNARYSILVAAAFADAYKLNRLNVVSMGNEGTSVTQYPAGFDGVVAVGGTDRNDGLWEDSSTGPHIDVAAPGVFVQSLASPSTYGAWTGTSFSAPHVSGLAGLLLSRDPNLYNDDLEQLIRLGTDDLDPPGWDPAFGTGRVNAYKTLKLLDPPYSLAHLTAGGGAIVSGTGSYQLLLIGAPGLADAVHLVKRYEVHRAVSFPNEFETPPSVWGRGVATVGYGNFAPNYTMGWCEPVAGTITTTGCTLRTFVYEVWTTGLTYKGWYPSQAAGTSFAYSAHGILKDLMAPSAVADLAGIPTSNTTITVNWTAPGDDGTSGTAVEYDLRFSLVPITEEEFVFAQRVPEMGAPQPAGSPESHLVLGLYPCTQYYFALKTKDDANPANWSPISNIAQSTTTCGDETPPAAVADLAIFSIGRFSAAVTWTAPGDDGSIGQAAAFDLRYATVPIVEANFAEAFPVTTGPPGPAGTEHCAEIDDLSSCTTYYFAIKTTDESNNMSGISNVPSAQTPCSGFTWATCPGGFLMSGGGGEESSATNALAAQLETVQPLENALGSAYPNPTSRSARIAYALAQDGEVTIRVYDVVGQLVRTLVNGRMPAGRHEVEWDARNDSGVGVGRGLYFYRMKLDAWTSQEKVVLFNR